MLTFVGYTAGNEVKNADEEFVHAPPVNMLEKENQEKVLASCILGLH